MASRPKLPGQDPLGKGMAAVPLREGCVSDPKKVLTSPPEGLFEDNSVTAWAAFTPTPRVCVRSENRFFPSHILWGVEIKPIPIPGQIPQPDANLAPDCDPQANINLTHRQQQK